MIAIKNLSKAFGSKTVLSNITVEIPKNEIVGLLGLNGAGKTTLMRILTSYLPFDKGEVTIDGYDVRAHPLLTKQKIGYLPENPPLYPEMSVREFLQFAAEIKNINHRHTKNAVDRVLGDCDLTDIQDRKILHLSKGTKQRVGIAQAIIHDPQILILDEPTNGLDPLQIIQVRSLIKNLESQRTVILSTHILPEIEHVARRVVVINNGQIIYDQPLDKQTSLENTFLRLVKHE